MGRRREWRRDRYRQVTTTPIPDGMGFVRIDGVTIPARDMVITSQCEVAGPHDARRSPGGLPSRAVIERELADGRFATVAEITFGAGGEPVVRVLGTERN